MEYYVVRNKSGYLMLFNHKPVRGEDGEWTAPLNTPTPTSNGLLLEQFPSTFGEFVDVTSDTDPVEVEFVEVYHKTKIWICRDADGKLYAFAIHPPFKFNNRNVWMQVSHYGYNFCEIDSSLFPEVTWECEERNINVRLKRVVR